MKQVILDALAKVDVENDDHWTADGAVRVDVVSELIGEEVTRADITAAAPKFNRKNTELADGGVVVAESTTEPDLPVDTGNQVAEDDAKGDGEIPEPQFANPWEKAATEARESMVKQEVNIGETQEAIAELTALRKDYVGKRVVIDAKIQEIDEEVHRLSQLCKQPELSLKEQLDMVLASEAGEVEEREKRRKLIKELMNNDKSMLDGLDMLD
ncbi:hypothetical protein [Vibrio phage vB_VpS_CA8]|nr:hypothetical protein [Vibrio phage vB_VpS_CA8]UFK26981.1 hypothetical protein [Vibrio phage vB_VpaS_AL-2]